MIAMIINRRCNFADFNGNCLQFLSKSISEGLLFNNGCAKLGVVYLEGAVYMENYKSFYENMILRDYLALDRTILANERTLLAYVRTFVGLMSSGVGMVTILDFTLTSLLGIVFISVAPLLLVFGIVRYFRTKKKLTPVLEEVYGDQKK